ncbi:MAG: endonuclease/exonuclease/phosphatase family protein [Phycisphaerae bacterium]
MRTLRTRIPSTRLMRTVAAVCILAASFVPVSAGVDRQGQPEATTRPTTQPTTQPVPSFTIATYNVCYPMRNYAEAVKTIRDADADIVCLQEAAGKFQPYIRKHLRKQYPHMIFRGRMGVGILSKHPIGLWRHVRPGPGRNDKLICMTKIDGKTFVIANLHLEPTVPDANGGLSGAIRQYLQKEKIRKKEMQRVLKALPKGKPVILVGDMNSLPGSAALTLIRDHGLADSYQDANPKGLNDPTWHHNHNGTELAYRLDYIYHDETFKTLTSKIVKSDASDHYLVLGRFRWTPEKEPTTKPADR